MNYHFLMLLFFTQSSFAQITKTAPGGPAGPSVSSVPARPQVVSTKGTQSAPSSTPNATDLKAGTAAVDALLNEDLIRSIRDPFQLPAILLAKKDAPKSDLEIFPLKDFKLNGVITGPKKTRAMITAPGNKVFFVKVGDRIGVREGHVSQVLTDSVKVLEFYIDEHGKNIPDVYELKITGELNSLSRKEEE